MRKLLFLIIFVISVSVNAEGSGEHHPLRLKDGSYLFMSEDDTMRMVDKEGRPVKMKDGVEMELKDGTLIMMKNKKIWRHKHQDMKR
jgi:glyoxylate utilization-related uncharacterized protein